MKKQGGSQFSWKLINGEAQITASRVENFLKINKRVYSSVPNRRIGPNKRAGGKILKKILNVQTQIRPCRGDFFLKINKRAGQIPL